ncbi:MAG: hypothetical protein K8I29_17175 [Alphaproteobacteria bacterium]|uniref:Uncharacterized protein n=1 Tax=Candidatus Nitrobium versatile TaxID=2884831 RepID=A0A953SEH6_9BACT|nr:hypothetical protein [Candidatus Nitrobium versatile]
MHITYSYIGTIMKPYRCLFFLLLEDYIEAQTHFARDLDLHLERFARNLRDSAALVRPFTGDIDTVRQQVLDKPWTEDQLKEVQNTPALLMIDQDFDNFDPRSHPWLIINFGRRVTGTYGGQIPFKHILDDLVQVVLNANENFFTAAYNLKHEIHAAECAKIFEAKPGIFGFSIDLVHAASILKKIYTRMSEPRNNG